MTWIGSLSPTACFRTGVAHRLALAPVSRLTARFASHSQECLDGARAEAFRG
jgi:hypothetical protein